MIARSAAPGAAAGVAGEPEPRDFRYWFKTGFAFFLPVMLFLLLLALAGLLWTSVAP